MRLLVISPHPDDETLGAGGTILKYKDMGNEIYWLNITNITKEYGYEDERVNSRNAEIKQVAKEYGFDGVFDLKLRPAGLDTYNKGFLVEEISNIFNSVKPNTVILPFKNDIHTDHQLVFEASYSCTKAFRYPFVKKILSMEVLSETDFSSCIFTPNYFVDISDYFEKKINIMKVYKGEMDDHPFPRSEETLRALALIRGAQSNNRYSEGFHIIKSIE